MYLYKVAYLGWMFYGSQIQPDKKTVEGELKRVIGTRLKFLSRTDRGVSSFGNVLLSEGKLSLGKINSQVKGIKIWAETKVDKISKIKYRHYRYFLNGEIKNPKNLLKFDGTHDFSEFSKKSDVKNTVRTVKIKIRKNYVDFYSRGFLWNQIRRMIGSEKNTLASPLPLILLDIKFETEPLWKESRTWLNYFQKEYKSSYAKLKVLESII